MSGLLALRIARGGHKADIEELRALAHDAQTADFTIGDTVTGGTSGATGRLVEQTDAGTTGTLILADVKGEFQDNETITDGAGGSATANGVLTCPLLTPDDEAILQLDAVDMTKADALECLRQLEAKIMAMDWPAAS